MDNATTTTHTPSPPPPRIFSAPPLSAAQIAILTSPPPPFPGPSSSLGLSPLEFLLAVVAVVAVPAIVCTLIFAFRCPSCLRRPARNPGELHDSAVADLRYRKDADVKEIGSECPVCLSAFADGEKLRQLSACKHSFHADCINLWLSNHLNCPVCRSTVAGAGGRRPSSSAPAGDHDLQQGLPDASALV